VVGGGGAGGGRRKHREQVYIIQRVKNYTLYTPCASLCAASSPLHNYVRIMKAQNYPLKGSAELLYYSKSARLEKKRDRQCEGSGGGERRGHAIGGISSISRQQVARLRSQFDPIG